MYQNVDLCTWAVPMRTCAAVAFDRRCANPIDEPRVDHLGRCMGSPPGPRKVPFTPKTGARQCVIGS